MTDRKVVWILICTLISNSAYALIAPFLPLEFKEQGISGYMIGMMFAIYSVAVIVCSPLVSKVIVCLGNTNMMSCGIATMGLAFVLFGFIPQIEDVSTTLAVGFILRFIQGASSAFVQTTCYSIATNDFPDRKEQIVGWVEALTGLGLIVGPIIGSTLYSLLGYQDTFFIYGSFLVFLSIIIKLNFPGEDENDSDEVSDDNFRGSAQRVFEDELSSFQNDVTPQKVRERFDSDTTDIAPEDRVTICKLLGTARYTMAALSSALCYFTYSFMEPILAERLVEFDLTSMQIGLFFAIWPVFYIPASIGVQYFPKSIDKRVTIILSALFTGFAFIFVGPSVMCNFPDSLVLMGIGQALVGIFTAFMMIPGLPEMVESSIVHYPGQAREVNDLSSGIYNAFLGFGQVLAPAYGAFVTEEVGFRVTSDIVAIICFVFALTYFILAGGLTAFRSSCKRQPKPSIATKVDNDFIRQLAAAKNGEGEENVSTMSKRSRKSSGFHMLGATPSKVNAMRVQQTFEEYDLVPASPRMQGMGQIAQDRSISKQQRNRIHSDIDGTPPGRNRLNESNENTPTRTRGRSFLV